MTSLVASTLVMGTLAALVLVALFRSRGWYTYSADVDDVGHSQGGGHSDEAGDAGHELPVADEPGPGRHSTETPTSWLVGFVALVALSVGGVFVFVTDPNAPGDLLSGPVLGVGGLLVVGYMLAGTYYAAKGRGHPSSLAAAESATVFGILLLLAVSFQLIG